MTDDLARADGTGLSQAEPATRLDPTGFDPSLGDYEIDAIRQAWALLARLDGRGRLRAAAYLVTLAVELPIRDSDGNPKGGDGTAPSRSDDSAGRNGIAQPSPQPLDPQG